ncbi:GNAT family N-acetyltransferase [Mycobacterium sp. CVI_P3]|uniref:GNAT family N-acetyltransferase n=1 Tax=Mycobacterium pinniadriaticum TaxID=2994102 RepID=A0ABT3SJD9_9MYCO|nr:GNAT family N-acetyltransferase [Mycobacterium pinniadriaticum]MCX2932844.1 GNAT family N-acetyltransferase [Mycobacterium pinniadriaticum]MCX2939268.1 GNAT family N-acetyltransferase [Mycobacterium pinniadriaticum]
MTTHSVDDAADTDIEELAEVAAATFPLACPPTSPPGEITAFIAANLSRQRFADYLADPSRTVLTAREHGRIVGYAILVDGIGDDADVARSVTIRPAVELSKIYVLADSHGSGVSAGLLAAAIDRAGAAAARCIWLGVNQENIRAQRFYAKHGFTIAGTKTFKMGTNTEHDFVMVRGV